MKKLRINPMPYVAFMFISFALISCNMGNKFAHSFGKRKYTKGYFFDLPSSKNETVAGIKPINRQSKILTVKLAPDIKVNNGQKQNYCIPARDYKKPQLYNSLYVKNDLYTFQVINRENQSVIKAFNIVTDTIKHSGNNGTFFSNSKYGIVGDSIIVAGAIYFYISFLLLGSLFYALTGPVILLYLISFIISVIALIICLYGEKRDKQNIYAIFGIIISAVTTAVTGLILFEIFLFTSGVL